MTGELRRWLLKAEIFEPGHYNLGQALEHFVIYIEALRAWKDEEVAAELERMEHEGLVVRKGAHYRSTLEGQVARERLLQAEGARAACLVRQHEHDVQDLVLAVVVASQIVGQTNSAETDDTLRVYLHERTADIASATDALIEIGYVREIKGLGIREGSRGYYPTSKGMRRYDEVVRERLAIPKLYSILDPSALAVDDEPRWGEYPDDEMADLVSLLRRNRFDRQMAWLCAAVHTTLSLVMIDIDWFKKVNDTFGHPIGDVVLRRLSEIVRDIVGRRGLGYRYGGEELAALLPGFTGPEALAVADRIRLRVESEVWSHDENARVTVSIGVAERGNDESLDSFVERADQALYAAKHGGRNRALLAPMSMSV